MRANRKDLTHAGITDIIKELRDKHGVPINFKDTHAIKGFGDFVLTFGGKLIETHRNHKYPVISEGLTVIVEVKTGNGEITDSEWDYASRCFGNYVVVNSFEKLLFALEILTIRTDQLDDIHRLSNVYHEKVLHKTKPYPNLKDKW